jgi:hypothetical protein
MNRVPTNDAAWSTAPFEPQYLKLYDVTAPAAAPGMPSVPNAYSYALGNSVTVSWLGVPAEEGVQPTYKVTYSYNNGPLNVIYTNNTSQVFTAAAGTTLTVTVQAVNPNDQNAAGPTSQSSSVRFIDPSADEDGDGQTNTAENSAGTNPFDTGSAFKVLEVAKPTAGTFTVTWTSVAGKKYQVEASASPTSGYTDIGPQHTGTGSPMTYTENPAGGAPRFYRVRLVP